MHSIGKRSILLSTKTLAGIALWIDTLSFRICSTFLYEEGHANTSSKNEIMNEVENVVLSQKKSASGTPRREN
jgi:hypothetical protein